MVYHFESRGRIYEINAERGQEGFRATINGISYDLEVMDSQPGTMSLRFAGRPVTLYWAAEGGRKWISLNGCTYLLEKPTSSVRRGLDRATENRLRTPMPAQVRSIEVALGDSVEKGQTLILLEAMKMEIRLQAPRAGRVAAIRVSQGQTVSRDQELMEIGDN